MQIKVVGKQLFLYRYAGYDKLTDKQHAAKIASIPIGSTYDTLAPEVLDKLTRAEDKQLSEYLEEKVSDNIREMSTYYSKVICDKLANIENSKITDKEISVILDNLDNAKKLIKAYCKKHIKKDVKKLVEKDANPNQGALL